jgi:hypothetical protein
VLQKTRRAASSRLQYSKTSPAAKRCLSADAVARYAAKELTRRRQRRPQHSERERGAVAARETLFAMKPHSRSSSHAGQLTRTTAWADLPEKAEAKGAAAVAASEEAEMAAGGAVRASVER